MWSLGRRQVSTVINMIAYKKYKRYCKNGRQPIFLHWLRYQEQILLLEIKILSKLIG